MVSSEITSVTGAHAQGPKLFRGKVILPGGPPDVVPSENVEFEFSDLFGPTAVHSPTEVNILTPDSPAPVAESNDEVYDDPVVIVNRSHSLVGPSSLVSQSLQFSKLTLREAESSLELSECSSKEKETNQGSLSDDGLDCAKENGAGLDDFEVLKLVGQGAFGKVYQVRQKGTSEIYAMKVMRKDKILEKNHAEYMKAERDILTKVDHPFVVQLRYSFQVGNCHFCAYSCCHFCVLLSRYLFPILNTAHFWQTKYRLYLVLDFINGGHLFFQLYNQGLFK
jgi:ribosomal protein S6 kinase beta